MSCFMMIMNYLTKQKERLIMWQLYVFSFFAGVFIANGVPHFVKGVLGQKNQTPFGKPSSAIVNVFWGWANLVIGAVFLHFAHLQDNDYWAFVILALALLLKALGSANQWSEHPEFNK